MKTLKGKKSLNDDILYTQFSRYNLQDGILAIVNDVENEIYILKCDHGNYYFQKLFDSIFSYYESGGTDEDISEAIKWYKEEFNRKYSDFKYFESIPEFTAFVVVHLTEKASNI